MDGIEEMKQAKWVDGSERVMDARVLGWLTLRRLHLMNVRMVALAHPWSFLSQLHKRTERASLRTRKPVPVTNRRFT